MLTQPVRPRLTGSGALCRSGVWVVLGVLLILTGCAGPRAGMRSGELRQSALVGEGWATRVDGTPVELDAFDRVLGLAGLESADELPPKEGWFTPEDAAELYELLSSRPVTMWSFGPRMVASYLLLEVMESEDNVPRGEMVRRVDRFHSVAVLRPDGYLAWAVDGRTQQKAPPLRLEDGKLWASSIEFGRFYGARGGVFRPLDEKLREADSRPVAQVHDDADVISRAMDGVEEAYYEVGVALGAFIKDPIRSVSDLSKLPAGVALLLENSPEYFEQFRLMTRGEQIRVVSKLTVTVLATCGGAVKTTRAVAAATEGLEFVALPTLKVAREGALVVQWQAVRVGTAVQALSGGPGGAMMMVMANQAAKGAVGAAGQGGAQGPGLWQPVNEFMSKRAARYQQQITGRPVSQAYVVKGVRFDGYKKGVLIEAKGKGYANKFNNDLTPKQWFQKGSRSLIDQADRQLRAAQGTPVRWYVAEEKAARAIRKLLEQSGLDKIEVVHTPALP